MCRENKVIFYEESDSDSDSDMEEVPQSSADDLIVQHLVKSYTNVILMTMLSNWYHMQFWLLYYLYYRFKAIVVMTMFNRKKFLIKKKALKVLYQNCHLMLIFTTGKTMNLWHLVFYRKYLFFFIMILWSFLNFNNYLYIILFYYLLFIFDT